MTYQDGVEVRLGDLVSVPIPSGHAEATVVMLGEDYSHPDLEQGFLDWVTRERVLQAGSLVVEWIGLNRSLMKTRAMPPWVGTCSPASTSMCGSLHLPGSTGNPRIPGRKVQNNRNLLTNNGSGRYHSSVSLESGRRMKRGATLFLRAILVTFGIAALVFLLAEPHFEGRNAHASVFAIYLKDPFLAYAYIAAIPFFVGLFQSIQVPAYTGKKQAFTAAAVRSVRIVKRCALALVGFVIGGEIFIMLNDSDDRAGGVFVGLLIFFASIAVVTAMAVLERIPQNGLDMMSGNNLTI